MACTACGRRVQHDPRGNVAWCKASPEPRPRPVHRPAITLADKLRNWAAPHYTPAAIEAAVARLAVCESRCLTGGRRICPDVAAWSCRGLPRWFACLILDGCKNRTSE